MNIDDLLKRAVEKAASDVHISVGLEPMARVHGALEKLAQDRVTAEDSIGFIQHVLVDSDVKILQAKGEVDTSYSLRGVARFRLNIFRQRSTYALAFRIIPNIVPSAEELGLPSILTKLAEKRRGLVLVTGPTGSGKSTTLAAMIKHMNENLNRHIVTIEDPIEYLHKHHNCIVNQREVGKDTLTFSNALRAALREDPDVILVGEMRDPETIGTAITAAETGHLVLSTLHTLGSAKTMDRIIDSFPPDQQQQIKIQLASTIEAVVSQQILPRVDKVGRVAAFEIMIANSAIRNLIREGKNHQIQTVLQTSAGEEMVTMDNYLLDLYQSGIINRTTLLRYAIDAGAIEKEMIHLG